MIICPGHSSETCLEDVQVVYINEVCFMSTDIFDSITLTVNQILYFHSHYCNPWLIAFTINISVIFTAESHCII